MVHAHAPAGTRTQRAISITADTLSFRYDGDAWLAESTSDPRASDAGNYLYDAFFSVPVQAAIIMMNGVSRRFDLQPADRGLTLQQLVTGTRVPYEPCDTSSPAKPSGFKAAMQAIGITDNLWNLERLGSAEDKYFTGSDRQARLYFNGGRNATNFRIGLLRDEQDCGCCPSTAEGVGLSSPASGIHEFAGSQLSSQFYAVEVEVEAFGNNCTAHHSTPLSTQHHTISTTPRHYSYMCALQRSGVQ